MGFGMCRGLGDKRFRQLGVWGLGCLEGVQGGWEFRRVGYLRVRGWGWFKRTL